MSGTRDRVVMFVDVQNVHITFEKIGQEVRYDVLLKAVEDQYRRRGKVLFKAVAFVPMFEGDERREKLINALSFMGYRVVTKVVKKIGDASSHKINMDIEMAMEIISMADSVDEVVLVTGDRDFVPIVDYLSKKGKRVRVIGTRKGAVSIDLIRACDEYDNMDEIEGILMPFRYSDNYREESRDEEYPSDL